MEQLGTASKRPIFSTEFLPGGEIIFAIKGNIYAEVTPSGYNVACCFEVGLFFRKEK